ncbi:hypothetical protein ABT023_17610 [Micromonospora sp. NPDC002296]|uniref:hypothetical protein n=1 Tax=Micromonospora sp. NPDC002296 TaxID=3154271 RepID=UPI00331FEA88
MENEAPIADASLREQLCDESFLLPTGVPGVFGYGRPMVLALAAVRQAIVDAWGEPTMTVTEFPAVMSRATLTQAGYVASFPHLVGSIRALPAGAGEPEADGEAWEKALAATDYVLAPASCYPVYPLHSGKLPAAGALVQVTGNCFRHEPSEDPDRLVSFRQLEFVRIADRDQTTSWFEQGREKMRQIGVGLGFQATVDSASDPFFGPARRILSAMQKNDGSKFELLTRVGKRDDVAVASANSHLTHLTRKFGIHTADGEEATSACVAFGLERLVFALVTQHGTDLRDWPAGLGAANTAGTGRP